jgi:hypothetical protein
MAQKKGGKGLDSLQRKSDWKSFQTRDVSNRSGENIQTSKYAFKLYFFGRRSIKWLKAMEISLNWVPRTSLCY